MEGEFVKTLTVQELIREDSYVIPLYQRNFAWEHDEIDRLLRDVEENTNPEYYIGTLVVSSFSRRGKEMFEVIDGQQRLTAINIIYSVLAAKLHLADRIALNLGFESRDKSNDALRALRKNGELDMVSGASLESFGNAVRTVNQFTKDVFKDNPDKIRDYLNDKLLKVNIFRMRLHPRTDKNHYFEVMNNRGEQLESHEIVKAKLLDSLKDEPAKVRTLFSTIWDACSRMDGRLEKNEAVKFLWGDRFEQDPLWFESFDDLLERFPIESEDETHQERSSFSLASIGSYQRTMPNPQNVQLKDELAQKYNSVIDFPNFLLQVLKIGQFKEDVRMDATKFLLSEFGCVGEGKLPDAKAFVTKLLRLRILFDKFIIKRELTDKTSRGWKWAIESPKYSNELYFVNTFDTEKVDADLTDDTDGKMTPSKHMCMLQAMFFVTFRRDVYMHWLTRALEDVDKNPSGKSLLETLSNYSVSYMRDSRDADGVDKDEYTKGQATHHYVFNFLDYQLWYLYYSKLAGIENPDLVTYKEIVDQIETQGVKEAFSYFIFTRRNSVEHFLAQEKGEHRGIDPLIINDFGNLSLISGGLNSRLSNRDCKEKKEYRDPRYPASLKYELMLAKADIWDENCIKTHGRQMVDLLRGKSDDYFIPYDDSSAVPSPSLPE